MLRKLFKKVSYLFFLCLAIIFLLELLYRVQLIDFYSYEFKKLNPLQAAKKKYTVLVVGDSFSAFPKGYVEQLREREAGIQFINASVPGTGIRQHALYFRNLVEQYQPNEILYQFYVGNDFLDIAHPVNFETLSFARNIYWQLSEHLLFLPYLNFKLAKFKSTDKQSFRVLRSDQFSSETYNKKEKIIFQAQADHLMNSTHLKGETKEVYDYWLRAFNAMIAQTPPNTKIRLVVIPHCAQVNKLYLERMKQIGAQLDNDFYLSGSPLVEQMKQDLPHVLILNPLDYFRKVESSQRLYYGNDPHLNPNGQLALTNFLHPFFEK